MHSNPENALQEELDFLAQPGAFPDAPDGVAEVIETHFACVFLTRRFVYKLKKPIRFRELDVRTLAARRTNCELEVSLNRRLAENVYIGVVPLCRKEGRLQLDGTGEVVDWLVKMHRLPRERMLDYAGVHSTVSDAELAALVDKLGVFYRKAARASWSGLEYGQALVGRIAGYAEQFESLAPSFDGCAVHEITPLQTSFVRAHAPLFDGRIAAGRVVDAHGDLRPEHICLGTEPQIIDCLEFSAALRVLDAAEEMAFLALECERIGCKQVGRRIYETYVRRQPDPAAADLYEFYRSVRAVVRALLCAWHLSDDADAQAQALWDTRARWYLDVAATAIRAAQAAPETRA